MSAGKRLFWVWVVAGAVLLGAAWAAQALTASLAAALVLLAWDLSLGSFVVQHALAAVPAAKSPASAPISVLIAAYDEAPRVVATVASVLAQQGVEYEILVGDDGSRDETFALATKTFAGDSRVSVSTHAHAGKAAVLNRLLASARHPLVLTLDADSALAPGAMQALSARFADPLVEAAAATMHIRTPRHLLTHFQTTEYIRNNFVRQAWAHLGALEQVPGACAAFRTRALRAVGGFPLDSITEDYEVIYRLYARAALQRRPITIAFVGEAVAFTDGPRGLGGFFRQRTRWFAGFLRTLVRFRALIFNRHAGLFGLVKLPLKVIDALIPLSSVVFLALVLFGATRSDPHVQRLSWALFVARWLWDAVCYAALLRRGQVRAQFAQPLWIWGCAISEALSYAWLRYVVQICAYPMALLRQRNWTPPRSLAEQPKATLARNPVSQSE